MYQLTHKQRESIERLAKDQREIRLYRETSMSGESETLRYQAKWWEHGRWGPNLRSESHMILSVKIRSVRYGPNDTWKDMPEDIAKFNALCEQAEALFKDIRNAKQA